MRRTTQAGFFGSLAATLLLTYAPQALACASCGSSGDDPLILYPNEQRKIFIGATQTTRLRNIDGRGQVVSAGSVERKSALLLAGGIGFSPRSFATLTVPLLRNDTSSDTRQALGDPSLASRYTVVMQRIDAPLVPQVQLLAGYKHSWSRSIFDTRAPTTLIDVFGLGFSEAKAGIDVWFGMTDVKPGFAQSFAYPLAAQHGQNKMQAGLIARTTLSLGYLWHADWRTTIGANREQRGTMSVNGVQQAGTEQLNHSAFMTNDYMLTPLVAARLTLARQGAFGSNYNTARSDTVSVAYMQSF